MNKNRGIIFGVLFAPFVLTGALLTACWTAYRMGAFLVIGYLKGEQ